MEPHQRSLANALLSSGMSHRGYFKASTIMSLEQILKETEKGSGPLRDPENYLRVKGSRRDADFSTPEACAPREESR